MSLARPVVLPSVLAPAVLSVALLGVIALTGCPSAGSGTVVDTPQLQACEDNAQCAAGNLCIGGECRLAACDPAVEAQCGPDVAGERPTSCCKVFENCNAITFSCERDAAAVGIGCPPGEDTCIPCEENGDCVDDLGFSSFCSGGRCFAQEGLQTCTQDFQCQTDERCDRFEFFCVPDDGGCRFCGPDFPELCCETGQACDVESGTCVEIGEAECTVATEGEDCRRGQKCDPNGRCVQCIANDDCGPGTECNPATGLCVGTASRCIVDGDCTAPLRCIDQQCGVAQCDVDDDCPDTRARCENFSCVLPPAVCNEDDEPNNTPAEATALTLAGGYSGALCRGDQDFLTLPVQPQKRYTITVAVPSSAFPVSGLNATLFDTAGIIESTATFSSFPSSVTLLGITGAAETGAFVLALNTGSNTGRDEWPYSVTIREEIASPEADCSAAAEASQEPNDDFAAATVVAADDVARPFTRCGADDVDFFRIDVTELHGLELTVDGFQNAEGNLNVELFRGPSNAQLVQSARTTANAESVAAPEGSTTYYARVFLASTTGVLANQSYQLRARAVPRPAECAADVGENDGTLAQAQALTTVAADNLVSASLPLLRCNAQDVDHVRFVVPANLGGLVRATFTHSNGDLRLDLLDDAGVQLATANASSASIGGEVIDLPIAAVDKTYVARVQLASATAVGATGQPYTLELSTYDAATCVATEPSLDNTFDVARCVGAFPDGPATCNGARLPEAFSSDLAGCAADPAAAGCGRTCGSTDADAYRLGPLAAERTVVAALRYTPGEGALALQLARVSGATQVTVSLARDDDGDGVISLENTIVGATVEYVLLVKPEGTAGHAAQPYALSVEVEGACTIDSNDTVAPGNATPATSTPLRASAELGQADEVVAGSLCSGDVDVFDFLAFRNEVITVRMTGLAGARLSVGRRASSGTQPAVPLSAATTAVAGDDGVAAVTFTAPANELLYLTLDRPAGAAVGDYALTLDFTP
jgi:hypothetical protein